MFWRTYSLLTSYRYHDILAQMEADGEFPDEFRASARRHGDVESVIGIVSRCRTDDPVLAELQFGDQRDGHLVGTGQVTIDRFVVNDRGKRSTLKDQRADGHRHLARQG